MLNLTSDYDNNNELFEMIRPFFECFDADIDVECAFFAADPFVEIDGSRYPVFLEKSVKLSRAVKLALYNALVAHTGKTLPYGALTGVRPTKLGHEIADNGGNVRDGLRFYGVCPQKAELIERIIGNQCGFSRSTKKLNFYVHIPFCTTRCSYCSFVSLPVKGNETLMDKYVELLVREIESGAALIDRMNYEVDSVYIGGGTPTALNEEQLSNVLSAIPFRGIEYTVEAGRPDTITESKLDIMKRSGVTRISVNPQSFCDKTLRDIGRAHTSRDIIDIYNKAKGDFCVNMDLIAGLSDETLDDFAFSIDNVLSLMPENVTVHTLAKKNGSILKNENAKSTTGVSKMVDYALDKLTEAGYEPYYLYRQKNMLENLENIGYSLKGEFCRNNITTMEELYSVFACGAGAISKRLFDGNRIERLASLRDVRLYIEQFDDRLIKKDKFFS